MSESIRDLVDSGPLIILDLANNHQGSVDHARRIIDELHEHLAWAPFPISVKFQYRQLDTFIHPAEQGNFDYKYIKRFSETRLEDADFRVLLQHIRDAGFLASCTPFDQESVPYVVDHGFDFIKVASCSFTDWPLLEQVAETDLPIVASTAGSTIEDIDRVVSFLQHRDKDFALMHCVAAYPTPDGDLQLNRIDALRDRYAGVPVGYSTHEDPDNLSAVLIALGKGAGLLERHVGLPREGEPLNAYSSTPALVADWLRGLEQALAMCGNTDGAFPVSDAEAEALAGLRRGVFVKEAAPAGTTLGDDDVFFAIPLQDGQVTANDWSKYRRYTTTVDLDPQAAVLVEQVATENTWEKVGEIVDRVRDYFARSGVPIPASADLEISHHYGLDRFDEVGMCMLTVVNREYCKKLLIMLPGQTHPEQWHEKKEETFHVLDGEIELKLDGEVRTVFPGETVTIVPGVHHEFAAPQGAIVEEISSTHFVNDSFYTDETISQNTNRKTFVTFWSN